MRYAMSDRLWGYNPLAMLDFTSVRSRQIGMSRLIEGLTPDDLRRLTNEMVDTMLGLIDDCEDAHVTVVPVDTEAFDSAAATQEEVHLPWTLGHVIVHTTASAEEAAAIAAELARGVPYHGRSRSEVPWTALHTLEQCQRRLQESRRMRLASLDMWPDRPDLENTYQPSERAEPRNAILRFVHGLKHDDDHLPQLARIVRQAKAAQAN